MSGVVRTERRSRGWSVCAAGMGDERRLVLVQPGDPTRGPVVIASPVETAAQIAMHACTVEAPDRTRIPVCHTPRTLRRLARLQAGDVIARWTREARAL